MRTAAEWRVELAAREQRLRTAREPWLRDLLGMLVISARRALRRAWRDGLVAAHW